VTALAPLWYPPYPMPRTARNAPAGVVFHVLNRAVGRQTLFRHAGDYDAFERVLVEAHERIPLPIFAWCLMPNHWHLVVRPAEAGQMSAFFRWLTLTHAMRWRVARRTVGHGPLYQGRFKSFPIQEDGHFLTVCRYVERNALTAGLTPRAQGWTRGSLWVRLKRCEPLSAILSPWPVPPPADWVRQVNEPMTTKEIARLEISERRGRPFGDEAWTQQAVRNLDLNHTVRSEGRPRKAEN